ncbi:MAG: SDR family oxidoreductase [Cyanobacteria bacterium REEB459]|nr:SDR family oxidoreductase [Cyanobacteria bacterium REEB459]
MSLSVSVEPVVLITGGAKRIGRVISSLLHERGFSVAIHFNHSRVEAEEFVEELNHKRSNSASLVQADLTDSFIAVDVVTAIKDRWGRLDGIVHNASMFEPTELLDTNLEDLSGQWDRLLNCHGKTPFFLAQLAALNFPDYFQFMVNLCDIYATLPLCRYSTYSISKSSLIMVTKTLAKELGPRVRVNAVAPGLILLPDGESMDMQTADLMAQRTCLSHMGEPMDIAKTVLFLAQDANYITGQIITVDGGRTLFC